MSGSGVKRKTTSGGSGSCKKKKDSEAKADELAKQLTSPQTIGGRGLRATRSSVRDVFCIVEVDGTIEDSKVWGPTMPTDMRRWLPDKMVRLIQASMVSAYKWIRVSNGSIPRSTSFKPC